MSPIGAIPALASFLEWQGRRFDLPTSDGGTVTLTLASVQVMSAPRGYEAFSITFVGPEGRPLAQDTYRFTRTGGDPIELFIVPVAQDAAGYHYQAIVNRPAPAGDQAEPPASPAAHGREERQ